LKEFTIGKNDEGQRLDRFVAKAVPLLPGSLAQKYIRKKRIKVGGSGAARDYRLRLGDVVQMYVNDEFFDAPREVDAYLRIANATANAGAGKGAGKGANAGIPQLDIVYEDGNILLLNKPAGVLCHSGASGGGSNGGSASDAKTGSGKHGGYDYASLIARVQAYLYQKGEWKPHEENAFAPALCNRIDRNTSGIVIAAKNAETLRIINEKIKLREIDKHYLAAVHGAPEPPSGTLENRLFKDAVKNRVYIAKDAEPGSRSAVTEYRTVASNGGLSLLECKLVTGRTHQIRAQLADAGHALLGDGKYGCERQNKPYGEKRQALCSYKTAFAYRTDSGALEYLRGKTFQISDISFVKKYFPTIDILCI
jgi:23S rRNA pseudouridine955/2504/2580 synthase